MNWTHIFVDLVFGVTFISFNELIRRKWNFKKIGYGIILGWITFTMISTTCFASFDVQEEKQIYYENFFSEIELRVKTTEEFFNDLENKRNIHRDTALLLIKESEEMAAEHLDDVKCLAYKAVVAPFISMLDGNRSVKTIFIVTLSNMISESYSMLNAYDEFRLLCMAIDYEIGMYDFYTLMIEKYSSA